MDDMRSSSAKEWARRMMERHGERWRSLPAKEREHTIRHEVGLLLPEPDASAVCGNLFRIFRDEAPPADAPRAKGRDRMFL